METSILITLSLDQLHKLVSEAVEKAIDDRIPDVFITQGDAMKRFGISNTTLYRWIHEGVIKNYGSGRTVKYSVRELTICRKAMVGGRLPKGFSVS